MSPPDHNAPTIFETTRVAPNDPVLLRPLSRLSLQSLVAAAQIVTNYPHVPAIQKFRPQVATLRLTPDEFEELSSCHARARAREIAGAPPHLHES
ncbi:MAG TPA: hypothetical protein VHE61_07850 [Opitutaceae bacterium]|nr:hypothetical protein [Opitutaceae bacterium]